MFRLPSWISESKPREKLTDAAAYDKMLDVDVDGSPAATAPADSGLKRSRADSGDALTQSSHDVPDFKRRKTLVPELDITDDSPSQGMSRGMGVLTSSELRTTREVIETQFSLEILLKHNELRLINQELAKCQVALEQLRRCHLVPYPATRGTAESMSHVMHGSGPAVAPKWAPPYGVVDGPYSRHYATFLRPDPRFDGVPIETGVATRASQALAEGRSTRNSSLVDTSSLANKARSSRASIGHKLQALPHGYPPAKPKGGPCTLKRGDGKIVKLVCVDCHREDFSSTQGFINHCRIAHHRDYKTHEEAAIGCGQVIELDEHGGIVGEEKISIATGLVHPLVRNAPPDRDAYRSLLSRIELALDLFTQGKLHGVTTIPMSYDPPDAVRPSFIPSNELPHLSNLMRSRGFTGNLEDLAADAQKRINLDDVPSIVESDEDTPETPKAAQFRPLGGLDGADSPPVARMPSRSGMPVVDSRSERLNTARSASLTAPRSFSQASDTTFTQYRPTPTFINSFSDYCGDHVLDRDVLMRDAPSIDLSPNTVSSNNAPSLVSDDGEYDEGSENETSRSDAAEEDDSDVAEIDIEDGDVVSRTVLGDRAGRPGERGVRLREKSKHVTFVSPMKKGE